MTGDPQSDVRHVAVTGVHIPAMSTLGQGEGRDVHTGAALTFVGDHRMMRDLGEALSQATDEADLPVAVVEAWQVTSGGESWPF